MSDEEHKPRLRTPSIVVLIQSVRSGIALTDPDRDAVNRRDLEAVLAISDENIVLISILTSVEGGYHGHEGMRRWWTSTFEATTHRAMAATKGRRA